MNVENALVNISAIVHSIARISFETNAVRRAALVPRRRNFALGVFVTLFVPTNVIDTVVILVLGIALGANALVTSLCILTLSLGLVAQRRIAETLIHVFALRVAIAFVPFFAKALNLIVALRNAVCIFGTRRIAQFLAAILDARDSVSKISFLTFAVKPARFVQAFRVGPAIVFPRCAFINIHTFKAISVIPVGTATGIASGEIFALCEIVTLVLQVVTFIHVDADFAIALVSRFALASITALRVDTKAALVAIVRSGGAFVNVGA